MRPAETPPPDFTAGQYIDSAGCVFVRDGSGWRPRLDGGAPICGYPPTLGTGRQVSSLPAEADVTPDLAMPGMDATEARLLAAVAGEMRRGDFVVGPPAQADVVNQPVKGPGQFGQQLAAAVATQPALAHAAAAGFGPSRRLCNLLGVEALPSGQAGRLGADPAMGYCAGNTLALPGYVYVYVYVYVRQAGAGFAPAAARQKPIMAAQSPSRGHAVVNGRVRIPSTARKNVGSAKIRPGSMDVHKPPAGQIEAMIPAGARWLEVGSYVDPASAKAMQRRLMAAGFPVGRGQEKGRVFILAGPYSTRQAIVSAHDRLARAGFSPLRPR